VVFWDPDWKDIVIYGQNQSSAPYGDYTSVIDEAIRDGFDGIYLDWVEAFSNGAIIAAAQGLGLDPASEMIGFIQEMRTYAQVRRPGFLIVQQNAPDLLEGHPELLDVIDGIVQEAIWYDGVATDRWGNRQGRDLGNPTELTDWYTGFLDQYRVAGLPVFDCEYALSQAQDAYDRSLAKGYVPYATRRALSRLTTTPPPGY
jgi:cysteinyl-tRNA synthetase